MADQISFAGQCVVVTGAGGGMGRAYALELARRNATVIVNDFGGTVAGGSPGSTGYADAVVDEIRTYGGKAFANYGNVADPAGAQSIIAAALAHAGRIDAVIANAGTMRLAPFERLTADDLDALLAVHARGSWNIAAAAWPHMKAAAYGRLVFTTSSGGMFGTAGLAAYGAAKGAVMGLMHSLSQEGAPLGILCNAVMPNASSRMSDEVGAGLLGDNPWARQIGACFDPRYSVAAAVYLASSACTTHHRIYSSMGGRVARVLIGVTSGHQGSRSDPLTADDLAANWDAVGNLEGGIGIPDHVIDEFRMVVEGLG